MSRRIRSEKIGSMLPLTTATIVPARRVHGRIRVPGDKSISHRYALLAALADGPARLSGYAPGADCASTLACLRRLGVDVRKDTEAVDVLGRGLGRLRSTADPLDAGNSGTTMRLLAGIVAGHSFTTTIVGDGSLSRRPMRRVIAPLEQMGATIDAVDGHAPLTIHGRTLRGIAHTPEVPSAQIKSAVLLAGLLAEGLTSVAEPVQTRDHTERALEAFGVVVERRGSAVAVAGGQALRARTLTIPGDFSSAAFWLVAAAALPESRVEIVGVGLNPTRTALLDVLRRFGARVQTEVTGSDAGEPRGTIVVESDRCRPIEVSPAEVPALIDELPAIAALATGGGEVTVAGAAELRVKESDRIAVLAAGFRSLGLSVEERRDGFTVTRPAGGFSGGVADARGDHRMAMAFSIAALAARNPSRIDGADSVGISYPDFFETLERLTSSRDRTRRA
jgi:3-phosphoshikimate 1-carboxyvinyltransferase